MRVSAEAIHDGVGQGWFIDVVIPLGNRKLRRDDRRISAGSSPRESAATQAASYYRAAVSRSHRK